ncbi:putative tetratricopeptide repeat protein SRFR1 [Dioscorea sansibarensis]
MAPTAAGEREELVRLCSSKNWSKAIRVLDSLLARSSSIQDLCNRAFCYSRLELHKHVIKDCDKALQIDSGLIQAYILKGNALSALGRKEEALLVWQQGYENAVQQSADLKQLLELEELLSNAKQSQPVTFEEQVADSPIKKEDSSIMKENQSVVYEEHLIDSSAAVESSPGSVSEHIIDSSKVNTPEDSEIPCKSDDSVEINSGPNELIQVGPIKIVPKILASSKTKSKSISLDFRLSRGIAQVNEGKYDAAISIFNQILRENPTSPEALIGRGTAHAFQRELELAIADFTKNRL